MSSGFSSNATFATAIVPSSEIWLADRYGLATETTCGTVAIRSRVRSIAARFPALVTVPVAGWKTTWAVPPAWAGNVVFSRSVACCDSTPGTVNWSFNSPPSALPAMVMTTTASTQAPSTNHRRRTANRPSR